jgi:hypothetical protein
MAAGKARILADFLLAAESAPMLCGRTTFAKLGSLR